MKKIKLVFFTPKDHSDIVRKAMGDVAGKIGNYSHISWSSIGYGRCIPLKDSNSNYGEIGHMQIVEEERIETICSRGNAKAIIEAVRKVHPYEELEFDIIELLNEEDL